jgi:hypothetical protein
MLKKLNIAAAAILAAGLSGCYIMPIDQYPQGARAPGLYTSQTAFVPMSAVRPGYTARLYPGNDAASRMGPASGVISNPENGRGEFTFSVGGETYAGEATRAPNSSKGVANAAGNRGGYVRCDYVMSTPVLGYGSCTFASGARFEMHITQ